MEKGTLFLKHGLDILIYNLIALTDSGHKEDIEAIEKHMYNEDLLVYIINKYENEVDFEIFKCGTYSIKDVNNYICNMASYVNGNESRKYGVKNEENGLLLLIAVCFDLGNNLIISLEKESNIESI